MNIRTACDNFEYQYLEILKIMKQEANDSDENFSSDYLWNNLERLGELFYESIDSYTDIENAIQVLNEIEEEEW